MKDIGCRSHIGEKKFVGSAMVGNLNFECKARTAIMGWRCKSESLVNK